MEMVAGWTGSTACALQAALRLSNEAFADQLGIAVRTVAAWHQKPALRPRPEMQQLLDTALAQAPASVRERFAVLAGVPGHAGQNQPGTGDDDAAADAEHRLITDPNISTALSSSISWPAGNPGPPAGTSRPGVARMDRRYLLDRASRRKRIGQHRVAQALGEYYRDHATRHGRYGARCRPGRPEIVTSVLTRPDWLDLGLPADRGP